MWRQWCLITIIILLVTGCGYSPLYSNKNNQNINIEIVDYEGDKVVNSIIRSRLKVHKDNENVKLFKTKIKTVYEKNDLTKNAAGNVEKYELKVTTDFDITRGEFNKIITISEKFTMENFLDDFEERNYEKKIKENFAFSIYQKFILQILQIK